GIALRPPRASRVDRDPALNLLDDPRRVLAARVIRGDDDHIAQASGYGAHQRALGAIAVASGAEHGDDPSSREWPRCLEQIAQRIVRMRVIDDDGDLVLGARHELKSTRDTV